jgi:iron(III) transport system substrate-binding protein
MRIVVLALTAAALVSTACRPAESPSAAPSGGAPAAAQTQGGRGAQQAATNELSPEAQRLIQAARDNGETELSLSWGLTSMGGPEAIKRYEALMNQMYGINIKINLTPGPSMPDMGVKITQEYLAGHKASSDIYLASDTTFSSVLPQDVLEPYDYTQVSPRVTRNIVAERNVGVEVYGTIPAIVYNTELVRREDVPRRLEGVLDPRWRGKMAASVTASYFDRISTRPEWGAEKMTTFITRLADHVGGLIRQSEEHRIISGEFPIFVLGNTHSAREQAATGAPLAAVVPEDAAQIGTMHLGVPRNAAHPNLAKLYINAVVSEPGQRILYETYFSDHYQLPGSQSAAELADLQARGVEIRKVDVKFALDHPELADLSRDFATILREKRGR